MFAIDMISFLDIKMGIMERVLFEKAKTCHKQTKNKDSLYS